MGLFNCCFGDDEEEDEEIEEKSSCISVLGCTGTFFLLGVILFIIGILFHNGWFIAIGVIVVLGIILFKFGRICNCDSYSPRDVDESETYEDSRGYMRFSDSGEYVHRWVAENYVVGRKLRRGEVVHHIDGDKLNNEPDNLEVMSKKEHDDLHGFKWW